MDRQVRGRTPFDQLAVRRGRFPAAVNGQDQCPQGLPFFQVTLNGFFPVLLQGCRDFGVAGLSGGNDHPAEKDDLLGPPGVLLVRAKALRDVMALVAGLPTLDLPQMPPLRQYRPSSHADGVQHSNLGLSQQLRFAGG